MASRITKSRARNLCSKNMDILGKVMGPPLRLMVAFKFEGDICQRLEQTFGSRFQRGEEGCPIDAALLPEDSVAIPLFIDIKTAMMIRKAIGEHDGLTGRCWLTKFCASESQKKGCHVYLIAWPLLRSSGLYVTIITHRLLRHSTNEFKRSFMQAWTHGSIENVVPPSLWPLTKSFDTACEILSALGKDKAFLDMNGELRQSTR